MFVASALFCRKLKMCFFPSTDKYKRLVCVIYKFSLLLVRKKFFTCVNIRVNGAT